MGTHQVHPHGRQSWRREMLSPLPAVGHDSSGPLRSAAGLAAAWRCFLFLVELGLRVRRPRVKVEAKVPRPAT